MCGLATLENIEPLSLRPDATSLTTLLGLSTSVSQGVGIVLNLADIPVSFADGVACRDDS